jgi:hypothetical protein
MTSHHSKKHHIIHNKTRKKGGIHIIRHFTPLTAINHFINNSTFSVFSTRGTTSIIVLATLHNGTISPYKTVRSNEFNIPVNKLLLKLCSTNIDNEVSIQKDIFHKSFTHETSYFEPICPSIVFASSNKMKKTLKTQFHNLIINSLDNTSDSCHINRIFEQDVYIIAMELMDNYKPLSFFLGSPNFQKYRFMALYELHRLHQFGYTHNDFHFENVLINTTYSYFDKTSGRAILIDFGYSAPIHTSHTPLELLQYEVSGINQDVFKVFDYLHTQRKAYQSDCLTTLEIKLNAKLNKIFNSIILYKGGNNMNEQTTHKSEENQKKHKPEYRENEWSGLDFESFKQIIANDFEKSFNDSDPEGFKKFNDSIHSVLEEQKTDPNYFQKLVKAQFNGLIVEPK